MDLLHRHLARPGPGHAVALIICRWQLCRGNVKVLLEDKDQRGQVPQLQRDLDLEQVLDRDVENLSGEILPTSVTSQSLACISASWVTGKWRGSCSGNCYRSRCMTAMWRTCRVSFLNSKRAISYLATSRFVVR